NLGNYLALRRVVDRGGARSRRMNAVTTDEVLNQSRHIPSSIWNHLKIPHQLSCDLTHCPDQYFCVGADGKFCYAAQDTQVAQASTCNISWHAYRLKSVPLLVPTYLFHWRRSWPTAQSGRYFPRFCSRWPCMVVPGHSPLP